MALQGAPRRRFGRGALQRRASQQHAQPAFPQPLSLTGGEGSNLPRHHFSSKIMMTVSTELRRRPCFVLKDAQPLREARLPRAWWAGAVWGEMLIRVRQSGCGGNSSGGSRPFPPTHRLQPRSCVSPLGLGPAQVPGAGPCPLPPRTGYISLAASLLSGLQTSFVPSLTPLTA